MKKRTRTTIAFPVREEKGKIKEICLALKKRGLGKGLWNGMGGKLKKAESYEEAVVRETNEEVGIYVRELAKLAEINFLFQDINDLTYIGTQSEVYLIKKWNGDIKESEEMYPKWFKVTNIPYEKNVGCR